MVENNSPKFEHTLLIIDDEVQITRTLYRQFRKKYNVFIAGSANDATYYGERAYSSGFI